MVLNIVAVPADSSSYFAISPVKVFMTSFSAIFVGSHAVNVKIAIGIKYKKQV